MSGSLNSHLTPRVDSCTSCCNRLLWHEPRFFKRCFTLQSWAQCTPCEMGEQWWKNRMQWSSSLSVHLGGVWAAGRNVWIQNSQSVHSARKGWCCSMLVLEMKDGFSAETRAHAYDIQMATVQGKKIKVCLWTRSSLAVACQRNTNSQASFNKTVALSYLDVYHLCQQQASVWSGVQFGWLM